jgi:hypothetical protein
LKELGRLQAGRILFIGIGGNLGYVMNTDGTGITNVTETPTVHDYLADWGAD